MTSKEFVTTIQESKGKYTTTIPTGLVKIIGIEKGDKLNWFLKNKKINIEIMKRK